MENTKKLFNSFRFWTAHLTILAKHFFVNKRNLKVFADETFIRMFLFVYFYNPQHPLLCDYKHINKLIMKNVKKGSELLYKISVIIQHQVTCVGFYNTYIIHLYWINRNQQSTTIAGICFLSSTIKNIFFIKEGFFGVILFATLYCNVLILCYIRWYCVIVWGR